MDRVEVLNGPQGTLYGANALGGAIKYITARPKLDTYEGAVETDMSGTDHAGLNVAAKAMLNVSLGSTLAIRLDGVRSMDSGWANDPGLRRDHLDAAYTTGGRASPLPDLASPASSFDPIANPSPSPS